MVYFPKQNYMATFIIFVPVSFIPLSVAGRNPAPWMVESL